MMWIVSAACRVDGRLLQPGEPLPDLPEERVARLERARCIQWVEPAQEEPELEPKTNPKTRRSRRR